ncbi:DUF6348 family protein [Oleiagrimonas sp. C23AA]|uniref:DUF6348 family protein n=1 Tax=Oleiagrimonas sp. C23AA TaxID=2719047 RepID=UPI00141F490F|nr:DUF6348 family protein [Oleiagrimonas sp. C23AA]NII09265.1 hypothetical protein [Oleiagrimonas sp. C23AA]
MNDETVQRHLLDLFAQYDVELEPDEDGWLLTEGEYPAIRGHWHETAGAELGRLDIDVVLDEDRSIEESFAGAGAGEAGLNDALAHFAHGALPVLLSACWYVTDERTFSLASWELGVRTWDVFISRWMLRGEAPVSASPDAVREALAHESLAPGLHAIRLFVRRDDSGKLAAEALLDNAPWAAGTEALAADGWEGEAPFSAHALMLLDVRDY